MANHDNKPNTNPDGTPVNPDQGGQGQDQTQR